MKKEKKISFVIPVYQNEGSIFETYNNIKHVFDNDLKSYSYEVIFIDDGSTDGSLKEALLARDLDEQVKVISFTRNFGQMAAMLAGLREACGDAVVNVSADLQDPISLVPEMVQKWEGGAEIVICHRMNRSDDFLSRLFSRVAYGILRLSVPQVPVGGFDYLLSDRGVIDIHNSIDLKTHL